MITVNVNYNGRRYKGTLVTYNQSTDLYGVDVSLDGKPSEMLTIGGEELRSLNPNLQVGRPGKSLKNWL